eukprot:765278-Hanusia_phi.AAC.3
MPRPGHPRTGDGPGAARPSLGYSAGPPPAAARTGRTVVPQCRPVRARRPGVRYRGPARGKVPGPGPTVTPAVPRVQSDGWPALSAISIHGSAPMTRRGRGGGGGGGVDKKEDGNEEI